MPFKFFVVPISDGGQAEAELNGFVRSHRVITVDRRWVDLGAASFWSLAVDYLDGPASIGIPASKPAGAKAKVDYKETLSPDDFAVFARLREARKEIAGAESVPVYAIFTNEQLAQMVRAKAATRAALRRIEGVGEARLDNSATSSPPWSRPTCRTANASVAPRRCSPSPGRQGRAPSVSGRRCYIRLWRRARGHQPGDPGRELEQQLQQLPVSEP